MPTSAKTYLSFAAETLARRLGFLRYRRSNKTLLCHPTEISVLYIVLIRAIKEKKYR